MNKQQRIRKVEHLDRQLDRVTTAPRHVKWPPTFFQFLTHSREATGPLGKVARYAMLDWRCWPEKAINRDYLIRHLADKHGDDKKAPNAFAMHEAFRLYYEFVASRKPIAIRGTPTGIYFIIRYLSLSNETHRMLKDLCARPEAANRCAVIEEAIRAHHAVVFNRKEA